MVMVENKPQRLEFVTQQINSLQRTRLHAPSLSPLICHIQSHRTCHPKQTDQGEPSRLSRWSVLKCRIASRFWPSSSYNSARLRCAATEAGSQSIARKKLLSALSLSPRLR